MKVSTKSLGLDTRFRHLYRPLVRKLLTLALLTVVIAGGAMLYFDGRIVRSMSATVIRNSTDAASANLQRLSDTVKDALQLAEQQVAPENLADPARHGLIFSKLVPFLDTYPMLDSINAADSAGNEVAVLRDPKGILTRSGFAAEPGSRTGAAGRTASWWRNGSETSRTIQRAKGHGSSVRRNTNPASDSGHRRTKC